ncbi:MAG: SelB C-terminal domain-containing protein, partial [Kiritimatiellae bacterium]|nr:SelB C-terminal domain-containing protein [Kiritimatiellia bacterium]
AEKAYIHKKTVERTRKQLIESLIDSETGITVAEFRDLIDGNRKICLALLTLFDNERTTIRKDNHRILSQKSRREYIERK